MFSFFKRKKSPNISRDESLAKIVEIVANTLDVQRSVLTDKRLEGDKGIKAKALGYLYGYTDAALHVAGFDTTDASVSAPVMFQVLRHLYPEFDEYQAYMDFLIKNIKTNGLMLAGAQHGGQQYVDWINSKGDFTPMGFARYILDGDD